jgi:hypothetical protein
VIPPALLFLLSIALAIRGLLCSNWLYFFNFSVILLTHPSSSVALHKEIKIDTELDISTSWLIIFIFYVFISYFRIIPCTILLFTCLLPFGWGESSKSLQLSLKYFIFVKEGLIYIHIYIKYTYICI